MSLKDFVEYVKLLLFIKSAQFHEKWIIYNSITTLDLKYFVLFVSFLPY